MKREMGFGLASGAWMVSAVLVVFCARPGAGRIAAQPDRSALEVAQPTRALSPVASRALLFQKNVIREIAPKLDQSDQRKLAEMEAQLQELLDKLSDEIDALHGTNADLTGEVKNLRQTNRSLETSTSQLQGNLRTARTELLGSLGAFILAVLEITRRYFATKQLRLQVQQLQTQVGGG